MYVEEGLKLAEKLLKRDLNELELLIFQESWKGREGKKYKEIADTYRCTEGNVNDAASDLWKLLSGALEKKVLKNNFRRELEKQLRSHSADIPQPQEQAQEETLSKNPDFVGREEAIADLKTFVIQGAKIIGVYGKGGVGKTKLAKQYFETQGFEILDISMGMHAQNIIPVENLVRYWLKNRFKQEPEHDFGLMLEQLKDQLQTRRIGVLINDLETALDEKGKLLEAYRRYVELLRVLADPDVLSVTLITSRERLYESKVSVEAYSLLGLDEETWREFFSLRDIVTASPVLSTVCKAYGGNALAMKIICTAIKEDYGGDLENYWRTIEGDLLIEGNLRDLVVSQFNRLQQFNQEAYQLLCRLGCYRYQNVPTVTIDGLLSLLWDVPEERQHRVVKSLQDRYLVEFKKNEYCLHSVIRVEAIERLKKDGEWKIAHRKAGNFWQINVSNILQDQQPIINQIDFNKAKDNEELLSLLITAAQPLENWENNQWTVNSFESIYHFLEADNLDSLEELVEQEQASTDHLNQIIINWLYELVDRLINLGLAFHQLGVSTNILAMIDENIGDLAKSAQEFEYGITCFNKTLRYFEDAILIANQVKSNKLVKKVQQVRRLYLEKVRLFKVE